MAVRSLRSSLKDPDIRRLRALRMIEMRIKGHSHKEIAKEFNVAEDTVARTLTWAKKAELIVQAEDRIVRELIPAATEALRAVLAGDDDEVKAKTALEIFKGTLPTFAKGKPNAGPVTSDNGNLSDYINKLRDNLLTDGEVLGTSDNRRIEGVAPRLLPAAAESIASEGLPSAAPGDESPAEPSRDEADSL
jgi:hypothetical protein